LLDKGSNPNLIDVHNLTPTDYCIRQNQQSMVELLKKHGGKTAEELGIEPGKDPAFGTKAKK